MLNQVYLTALFDLLCYSILSFYVLACCLCCIFECLLYMQVLGKVPTISINKTDGCHVYLSQGSLSCEIVSAKSSEMNVLVPGKDGDFVSD